MQFSFSKLSTALVLSGMSIFMLNSASASDSVDLKVTGTVTLGSCTPVFDNSGTIDYGTIGSLDATNTTDLGVKSTKLTITCDDARTVGFTITDNASSSAIPAGIGAIAATNAFGLGTTKEGVNLGSYSIKVASVALDGVAGDVLTSGDAGTTWGLAPNSGLATNQSTTTWAAGIAGTDTVAAEASTYVYDIDVDAVLQDSTTLALSEETALAGSTTFTLVYL
ncbi:DUF1120 domain-containing protein [Enterobacter roggenkampii]